MRHGMVAFRYLPWLFSSFVQASDDESLVPVEVERDEGQIRDDWRVGYCCLLPNPQFTVFTALSG